MGWALNPVMGVLVRKPVKTWDTDTERSHVQWRQMQPKPRVAGCHQKPGEA